MKFVNEKIKKYDFYIYFLCFVILTIPRSIDTIFPILYDVLNVFKIIIFGYVLINCFLKKIKLSKLTIGFIIYFSFLLIVTLINGVDSKMFLKVYLLNVTILLLCELIFNSFNKERFIKIFSSYFFCLLVVNLLCIFIGAILGHDNFCLVADTYFLGQDNRFILYILPTLIGYYYLINIDRNNKKYKKLFALTYIIGLLSLIILWSVSAFVILLLLGILLLLFSKCEKRINLNILFYLVFIISALIVFFRIHNMFEYIIVNILHKSMTLSYRTIIWDDALYLLKNNVVNIFFGFGYFDTSNSFPHMSFGVVHLHNLIMNLLFFSGIIGFCLYFRNLIIVRKSINKIKNVISFNYMSIFFVSLLFLMIFDTFELYQLYYFILILLFESYIVFQEREHKKKKSRWEKK